MKSLIVYYSLEGDTQFIAQAVAEATGGDLLRLQPVKDIPTRGFGKYFFGGMYSIFNKKMDILPVNIDPQQYDMIFVGTPVWAGRPVPAIRSYFSVYPVREKKFALFCCCAGDQGKAFGKLEKLLEGNFLAGSIECREPLKFEPEANKQKVQEWARKLIENE